MVHQNRLFCLRVFVFLLACCSLAGCVSVHYDSYTCLVINGNARDSANNLPLDNVSVTLLEDFSISLKEVEVCITESDGIIYGIYERRWGRKQNYFSFWYGTRPDINLKIKLTKESYNPVEIDYILDDETGISGEINLDLGEVFLEQISESGEIAYEKYLQELETDDRQSILKAIDFYQNNVKCMTPVERDLCFIIFRKYYLQVIDFENTRINSQRENAPKGNLDSSFSIDDGSWSKYGMDVLDEEAYEYVVESHSFLLNTFQPFVSESISEYLLLRAEEEKQIFQRDAAIMIHWKELAVRCLNWEDYLKKYNGSSMLIEDARELNNIYTSAFLSGTNNTRVFESDEKHLLKEWVSEISEAYKWVIDSRSSSSLAFLLQDYLPLLKESNFVESMNINEFLKKHEIEPYYASRTMAR